ncbi:predicted protein [Aspergillus terreus NIH2624]|uniref:UBC core domain-containing protein n=1 Tax=Aspergillus terreus (strain NIH 2624 / FGSC A1156) TaxID=341663 RepID=Q0CPK4_ASPTN|nr:uncharacterized protein ATEG_04380 [Aspergillus terreus NIH2624]EAU34827.1 predicted protein [Aspergillus terreus NIH2624]
MPRKDFLRDLNLASIPGIFPHTCAYPKDHQFFVFSDDDIPASIATALTSYQPLDGSPRIEEFLTSISRSLDQAILGLEESSASADDCDDDECMEEDEDWDTDHETFPLSTFGPSSTDVLRSDLRAVKSAGYKVGVLGDVKGSVIVCISCRIGKLGISEEALQAWHVEGSEYLTLLLRYPLGYVPLSQMTGRGPQTPETLVQMHVGVCKSYKPSLSCALRQFVLTQDLDSMTGEVSNTAYSGQAPAYRCLQIAESLNNLLETDFLRLLKFRLEHGFSWAGAETYLHTAQGESPSSLVSTNPEYFAPDDWSVSTPGLLKADHLANDKETDALVFPLIAMQFVLRRFVKCTEFCLNCYRKVEFGFEAIKPYVCSNGLCLYQYMHLGMGPSVEWEILSQPYVADLLISFTYCSAKDRTLHEFPCGIGLKVPTGIMKEARFDVDLMEITVEPSCQLRVGDWICITTTSTTSTDQWHCEVQDIILFPHVKLSTPVRLTKRSVKPPQLTTGKLRYEVYNKDFDSLSAADKCTSIVTLLATLPAVDEMRDYITNGSSNNVNRALSSWHDRVSPAALYVLRWVIASNRPCILYHDDPEHMVSGMSGYLQFRFAQGAPDKEARFVQAVNAVSSTKDGNSQHPTLFAWHGSPLHNWHSILREGLHYKKVVNGRSCGNGVYMSNNFATSVGYCGRVNFPDPSAPTLHTTWPQSKLNIKCAISLNEVVNAPNQFVHNTACYVVQHLDWIQPRYLFVGPTPTDAKVCQGNPSRIYTQDPKRLVMGAEGKNVKIPISGVATHKANVTSSGKPKGRRKKSQEINTSLCDADSVATLEDDRQLLRDSDKEDKDELPFRIDISKTDFRPGTLEVSSLRLLGPPRYATTTATKALHKRLQETLKVQKREPLHELGWYIDPSLVNNVYQWIVELHSFDPNLPLAKDLKKAKVHSIVFEIRFPPYFPMSPPFVRIIRPRILSFGRGGGGHVTLGGSMCMELLTNSGWSAACSMESVLLQVRLALSNTEPQPARLDQSTNADYTVGNAISDYQRVCQAHGWQVPDDLQQVHW